jgi:hypothetical protein
MTKHNHHRPSSSLAKFSPDPCARCSCTMRGCQPAPHRMEPFLDSPAMVGGTHWQASTPRWREGRPPLHQMESFTDSPVTVGGAHRQASTSRQRGEGADRHHNARSSSRTHPQWWEAHTGKRPRLDGVVGRRHTARSRSQTWSRWWEACTGKRLCLDGEGRVPTATTPCRAILGLARVGVRHASASVYA